MPTTVAPSALTTSPLSKMYKFPILFAANYHEFFYVPYVQKTDCHYSQANEAHPMKIITQILHPWSPWPLRDDMHRMKSGASRNSHGHGTG